MAVAIDYEHVLAGGIEDHSICIRCGGNAFDGLEGLQVKGTGFARAAIVGVSDPQLFDDSYAMGSTRKSLDLAHDRTIYTIHHLEPIAVRDENMVRGGVKHHVVPAIRRT